MSPKAVRRAYSSEEEDLDELPASLFMGSVRSGTFQSFNRGTLDLEDKKGSDGLQLTIQAIEDVLDAYEKQEMIASGDVEDVVLDAIDELIPDEGVWQHVENAAEIVVDLAMLVGSGFTDADEIGDLAIDISSMLIDLWQDPNIWKSLMGL